VIVGGITYAVGLGFSWAWYLEGVGARCLCGHRAPDGGQRPCGKPPTLSQSGGSPGVSEALSTVRGSRPKIAGFDTRPSPFSGILSRRPCI